MIKKVHVYTFLLLTAVLLSLQLTACSPKEDEVSSASWTAVDAGETILPVEALEVTKGKLIPAVRAYSVVSGKSEAYVISETSGLIKEVYFEIGDTVKKGEVLLKVDDTIARLSMEQAKQQYETARIDLESIESFHKQGSASNVELSRARSAANGARSQYETAKKVYEDCSLKSPINGAVSWKDQEATIGSFLNRGMRVAKIIDMSSIRIKLSLGERQIGLIDTGAKASIFINSLPKDNLIYGKVSAISAGSDVSTGSFPVIVEAPNNIGNALLAGMSTKVVIETNSQKEEIIIPSSSIVIRSGKEYVFVENNGDAAPVEISKGTVFGNRTTVTSGLSVGDYLIISGLSALRPGSKVKAQVSGKTGDIL